MKKLLSILVLSFLTANIYGYTIEGTILDESNTPLPYPTIRIKSKPIAVLGDSNGVFKLESNKIKNSIHCSFPTLGSKNY